MSSSIESRCDSSSRADLLFHYTDASGILGILRTGKLWCTHISYLNDSAEYKQTRLLYSTMLKELRDDLNSSEISRLFAKAALFYFDRDGFFFNNPESNSILHHPWRYFVASFSKNRDDLALWRGYTSPGPRFSIGFKINELKKLIPRYSARLEAVSYESAAVIEDLRRKFSGLQSKLASRWIKPAGDYSDPMHIFPPVLMELNESLIEAIGPFVKDHSFHLEKEWRLVIGDPDQSQGAIEAPLEFRPGKSTLVPYREVCLRSLENPIASITVGPTPNMSEAIAALHRIARWSNFPLKCGNICPSNIPYRDW